MSTNHGRIVYDKGQEALNLRTFTARTMAEALVHVRRTMGADAVILHTRSYKRGGVLGFGAKSVVEVTAADGREVGRTKRSQAMRDRQQQLADLVARRKQGAERGSGTMAERHRMASAARAEVAS